MTDPARGVGHHFDAWAPSYDAQIREMVPRYEEIHDTLLALLALKPPERFLDLGSGTGYTLRRVLEAFPSARAVGLDVSNEMLDRARQRLAGLETQVDLRLSDIARPELDATYDAIVSILAVHHLHPDEKRHLSAASGSTSSRAESSSWPTTSVRRWTASASCTTSPTSRTRTRSSTTILIPPPST